MASGRLGKATLPAAVAVDLYTVPVGFVATANISLCNRSNSAPALVRVAVRSGAIGDADFLEYDHVLPPNGVLERTGVALTAGEIITVQSSQAAVSACARGFEEAV
jgi:hypothetical protein